MVGSNTACAQDWVNGMKVAVGTHQKYRWIFAALLSKLL